MLYRFQSPQTPLVDLSQIRFFSGQNRLVLRNCGVINPESISEYLARDGYHALATVITTMTPPKVIEAVKKSGLRGRGGAGFSTGAKWEFAAEAPGEEKYIVCNADEGDPGAFMDRSILEGDPHSVIEGMAIAGYAVGAAHGYIYIRAEYPVAVQRVMKALEQARENKLLGSNIFSSAFNFNVEVRLGAGAFVCGEETALLTSIEGKRGEPRPRPPFPAKSGLWGKPTIINNVETLANVPQIILNGWEWFASIGTEKSKGTKVFALAGKVRNSGLVEVSMGMPLGRIVYEIGGGIPDGKKFKAAQTGGPSGGCVPREHLNTPVDYESLAKLGTIIGSGGLIVMDEDTCMVDLAKYFLQFVQDESCGKCSPCRIGTRRMLEILDRITMGQGEMRDLELLSDLAEGIKATALCGLGQTAPNPVQTTIKYFRDEYEAHIRHKYCPASVCAALFTSPCQNTCPAGVDVPVYIDLVKSHHFKEAYAVVQADNPFPAVCGRVCHHPCEGKCRRGQLDDAVAIKALKRFAGDYLLGNGGLPVPAIGKKKESKIAVVGSGPAGLTCAFYLTRKGYPVTVFEALPVAGGMMAVGIPEYRLPKAILSQEIDVIRKMGANIRTGVRIGRDITLKQLMEQGYEAIFVGIGAHCDQLPGLPGENLKGVLTGVNFLREVNLGRGTELTGKAVAVIGGGNVAADSARTALRLGGKVSVYYRRTKEEMPAMTSEIVSLEREGIAINELVSPVAILGNGEKVTGLTLCKMQPAEFDETGRRRSAPIPGSAYDVKVDIVIVAVGQVPESDSLDPGLTLSGEGTLVIDEETLATNIPGVFAGGDCVTGPGTLVGAVASGKKAAASLDRFLGGDGIVTAATMTCRTINGEIRETETPRQEMPTRRSQDFLEVELGYYPEQAIAEAMRCLRCDVNS